MGRFSWFWFAVGCLAFGWGFKLGLRSWDNVQDRPAVRTPRPAPKAAVKPQAAPPPAAPPPGRPIVIPAGLPAYYDDKASPVIYERSDGAPISARGGTVKVSSATPAANRARRAPGP